METAGVLRLFDRQLRREAASGDPGVRCDRGARTTLALGDGWSAVLWSALDGANADEEIGRTLERLRTHGGELEWKLYGYDRPPDLPARLAAAGLEAREEEAVLVAELAELELDVAPPAGVELRLADDADGVAALVALHEQVFGGDHADVGRALLRALERRPPQMLGVLCLVDGMPVSAARIELNERSVFASLWGGATLPEWRGRGFYRATVAYRGRLASGRGYEYLHVDALPTSRRILERLGFVRLTTTTPYTLPRGAE